MHTTFILSIYADFDLLMFHEQVITKNIKLTYYSLFSRKVCMEYTENKLHLSMFPTMQCAQTYLSSVTHKLEVIIAAILVTDFGIAH